ncbi:DUF1330 domain-containing protein [Streptomyces coeruleorubidus]|uniref:DUF1330 domain-containing protein n=1 Tax=Streptomyces coeruleorubidus TaxID=116188 RepID=A0A5J6IE01_STRC4|nr:DUF1330 domain-containing protein [Streptomyces coeruleorubidus]
MPPDRPEHGRRFLVLHAYKVQVLPVVAKFGGTYRVIAGNPSNVEGDWHPAYLVMLEFPSVEQAKAWYDSPEYEPLKRMRLASARGTGVLIEGLPAAG